MPIALIVIFAVILFFVLLLMLPVRVVITCREAVTLKLKVLCFTATLFPRRTKPIDPQKYTARKVAKRKHRAEKKAEKKARRAEKKAAKKQKGSRLPAGHAPKQKPTLRENIALVRALAAALIRKTNKHLRLTAARLNIRVATGDAATTAILYGAVSASLAYLLAALDRVTDLKTKPREMSVFADYLSEKPSVDLKLVFSLRVWGALALLFSAALTFIQTRRAQKAASKAANADK